MSIRNSLDFIVENVSVTMRKGSKMEAKIILRKEVRKTQIEKLSEGEGFIDHAGDLRVKLSDVSYIRFDGTGRVCELNHIMTCPTVTGPVKKFEFIIREL
jgi:hypothetical protein